MSHASKIILRIVVTVLILALVGLSVWLIFFRPSDSVTVFDSLSKLEKEEKTNFNNKMFSYGGVKGINAQKGITPKSGEGYKEYEYNLVDEEHQTEVTRFGYIKLYRAFMFYSSTFEGITSPYKDVANAFAGENLDANKNITFEQIYNTLDSIYIYYLNYVQLASGFDKGAIDGINNKVSNLKSTMGSALTKVKEIENLQTQIPTTYDPTVINEIYRSYGNLYVRFFEVLKSFNNLTIELKNFVNKYVFDSNVVYDSKTVAYEIAINTISEFTNKTVIDPIKFFDPKTDLTEEEQKAFAEELKNYQVFLSHSYDACVTKNLITGITPVTDTVIQYYVDLKSYNGENAAIANAITGSKNIFTLTRTQKAQLVKSDEDRLEGELKPSDLYYTDNFTNDINGVTFGDKIVSLINTVYNAIPAIN